MNDQPNLRNFVDEISSFSDEAPAPESRAKVPTGPLPVIGTVLDIAGSGSMIRLESATLAALQSHSDPSVSMSGCM